MCSHNVTTVVVLAATVLVETFFVHLLYAGSRVLPLSASSEFTRIEDVRARVS